MEIYKGPSLLEVQTELVSDGSAKLSETQAERHGYSYGHASYEPNVGKSKTHWCQNDIDTIRNMETAQSSFLSWIFLYYIYCHALLNK